MFFVILLNIKCNTGNKEPFPLLNHYASLNDTVKYMGKDACKSCHADIYESFMHTGMGLSFDIASRTKSSADFDHAVFYDSSKNFYYHPYWVNDSLHIKEFRLLNKDTVYVRDEVINYIVGSGQHTNSHIIATNGYLNQAPATFYTQKREWHLPPGFEAGNNSRFSRIIGLECMTCHNSYPEFVLGSENKYQKVEKGISCERCHGPGEYHIKQKQLGVIFDTSKTVDYSIVNPAKLSVDLQFDICQRCHIQGNAVLKPNKSFLDFKPGMKLSDVMDVYMPVYEGNDREHIMASHAERLKLSACYIQTMAKLKKSGNEKTELKPYKNALTCVTCHNPHISVRLTDQSHFNKVCSSCHQTEANGCTEQEAVRSKSNNNCVSCHMPFSGTTDIPHVSVHDHKISIPSKGHVDNKHKVFKGIACINNANTSSESKGRAFISYFEKFNFDAAVLDSALHYFPEKTSDKINPYIDELIHIYYLKGDFSKVIQLVQNNFNLLNTLNQKSYDNRQAWTAYRIGAAFQALGKMNESLPYFQRAAKLAPYHLDILNKYATALSINGNYKDAQFYFEHILAEYPKHVSALTNLGFIYLSQYHNPAKALAYYNSALQLNPDYEQALMNMAGLMLYERKATEARVYLQRVLKINPKNSTAMELLKQIAI